MPLKLEWSAITAEQSKCSKKIITVLHMLLAIEQSNFLYNCKKKKLLKVSNIHLKVKTQNVNQFQHQ